MGVNREGVLQLLCRQGEEEWPTLPLVKSSRTGRNIGATSLETKVCVQTISKHFCWIEVSNTVLSERSWYSTYVTEGTSHFKVEVQEEENGDARFACPLPCGASLAHSPQKFPQVPGATSYLPCLHLLPPFQVGICCSFCWYFNNYVYSFQEAYINCEKLSCVSGLREQDPCHP